jgi:hypothetical protein
MQNTNIELTFRKKKAINCVPWSGMIRNRIDMKKYVVVFVGVIVVVFLQIGLRLNV